MLKSIIRTLTLAALAGALFFAAFFYFIAHAGLNKRSCDVGLFMTKCIE
ncbi:hypothetical protein MCBMB27_05740 (plasmid) [Methylobacterium phyllosphaerae]|uniref:Uncharacterized protein n=1 Tax=Methylobacterium phyllosphaerae TaxID=418223 RepID=A0AAE8L9K6_9HYPH|nr:MULTISPECIES: hypothetical protein [Methylobacterium]APT35031.1 hypothetical protein MCBMB27_05740 [Methylobacterium phyllosphaerae]SFH67106.1 hypothetical protein SAMN05192567_1426 [Methylobacterium phyllosphaerae]